MNTFYRSYNLIDPESLKDSAELLNNTLEMIDADVHQALFNVVSGVTFESEIVTGDIVYLNSSGVFDKAIDDLTVASLMPGLANVELATVIYLGQGVIKETYALNTPVYLSNSTPGDTTSTTTRVFLGIYVGDYKIVKMPPDFRNLYYDSVTNIALNLNKNFITDGNFELWREATSQTSSGYGSDDLAINSHVGSTKLHSRQDFALGQIVVPGNPKYYSRTVVTSVEGVNNYVRKSWPIEDVTILSGGPITIQFYAREASNKPIAISIDQVFGTGGSPSESITGIAAQKLTLSSAFTKKVIHVVLPDLSGKTLGTNNDSYLQFNIWFDAGSNFNVDTDSLGQQSGIFDISRLQIEKGEIDTEFQLKTYDEIIAEASRYLYYDTNPGGGSGLQYVAALTTGAHGFKSNFPVAMRKSPAISYLGYTVTNCSYNSIVATANSYSVLVNTAGAAYYKISGGTIKANARLGNV